MGRRAGFACVVVACMGLSFQFDTVQAAENCPRLAELVALDMYSDTGALLVKAELNNKPYLMSVGMGVALSILSQRVVKELNLKKSDAALYGLVDGKGRRTSTAARVDSFKLGMLEAKDVSFITRQRESDEPEQPDVGEYGYAGVIGNNILTFYDIELDFAHRKMRLLSTDHCEGGVVYWSDSYSDVKLNLRSGIYELVVQLNDSNAEAAVSTSTEWTYVDLSIARHKIGFDEKAPGVERMSNDYAYFDKYPVYKYRLPSLQIAGVTFQNTEVLVTHLGNNLDVRGAETSNQVVLGLKELRKLRLYFASREQRLYVTPANAGK
jgi:hypothetical protein